MARKILLADDSVTAQNMGRRILSDAGYDVITVNNGSSALKRIAEAKPDLIVLDVYMPGYGGLEVCQRIRETPETARIPVLLTVGKLEPFKPDEARRVRADAYIIKPFEASELLTALTKLEDKIVPQAQPHKPGRFAKVIAAIEEPVELSNEYGDTDKGWKNRLKIPPPHAKAHEPHPEAPISESKSRDVVAGEEQKSGKPELGMRAILSVLPQDVTREEIAAIEAAAAAFSAQAEFSSQPRASDRSAPVASEPAAETEAQPIVAPENQETATFASAPEAKVQATAEGGPVPELQVPATAETTPEASHDVPAETEPVSVAATSESVSTSAPASVSSEGQNLHDDEVTAALSALVPTNGGGETPAYPNFESIPVTMAAAFDSQEYSGPRWIAEAVPLTEDDSRFVLEHEMQKAFAALAAADAARIVLSLPNREPYVPAAEESVPPTYQEFAAPVADRSPEAYGSEFKPEEAAFTAANTEESPAAAVSTETVPPEVNAVSAPDAASESASSEVREEAAYAAAASASSSAGEPVVTEATSQTSVPAVISESTPTSSQPNEGHRESELAAAWASWRQVRESVEEAPAQSHVDEAPAPGFREIRREEPPSADAGSQPEASADASDEGGAIASIVDSVLAELKPKLMEEIARKMGKEPKKK